LHSNPEPERQIMSYLNGPRINFWGGASTNVDTANNSGNGIVDLLHTSVIAADADDVLIARLRTPALSPQKKEYFTVAGWNYYGDHQVGFMNAVVSSAGAPGAVSQADDLVKLPVYLLGSVDPVSGEGPYGGPVMVDLDPTSSSSTQIYVGGLQIGGAEPALLVRADVRCNSHFLGLRYPKPGTTPPYDTPGSAWANGTFQLAFPRAAIQQYNDQYRTLASIVEAPGAIGIVVRFCMFEFFPGMSTTQLLANYGANYNDSNPSLGRIIGTIGPWFPSEPATCPNGRLLENTGLPGAQGVAWLDTTASRLTLDLSSALEASAIRSDPTGNTAPIGPNVDYGDLQIGTAGRVLASTPSLPDTYYLFGGVYDVALDDAAVTALASGPIEITSGNPSSVLSITEWALRIFGDARNVYLDDGKGRATVDLLVRYLGGSVPNDTLIALTLSASGDYPAGGFLSYPPSLLVRAGSDAIQFDAIDNGGPAGFVELDFGAAGSAPHFVNFRKYPRDDYSAQIAAGPLEWEFVYEKALRYFYLIFPAMSKRIPLNDQSTVKAVGGEILKRLSSRYHFTTLRMPVTRSLSPDKVELLATYLRQQDAVDSEAVR
jgi:hypothetical protein